MRCDLSLSAEDNQLVADGEWASIRVVEGSGQRSRGFYR